MTYQKLYLFQAHYGRHANAIQNLQLSLPLSVIIIYLTAQQYSCVLSILIVLLEGCPPGRVCLCLQPLTLCLKSFWNHSPHTKDISAWFPVIIYSATAYWTSERWRQQAGGCVLDEELSFFIIFYYLSKQLRLLSWKQARLGQTGSQRKSSLHSFYF